jgi:hypothetical protein
MVLLITIFSGLRKRATGDGFCAGDGPGNSILRAGGLGLGSDRNFSKSVGSHKEVRTKRPTGTALVLLNLIRRKGIQVIL